MTKDASSAASEAPPPAEEAAPHALARWERRYRSGMMRSFGPLFLLSGLPLVLRRLRFEEHSAENVRLAASRGPVVYVLHTRSTLDWLALNVVLNRRRLPLARLTPGIRISWVAPLGRAVRDGVQALRDYLREGQAPDPIGSGVLTQAVSEGVPTAIYLVRPGRGGRVRADAVHDPIAALLTAQARSARPVQAVPVVVAWNRAPAAARTQVGRFILGTQDTPGPLQKLWQVVNRDADAVVQCGAPLDLSELVRRLEGAPEERQVRTARLLLRRYTYRESRVVKGPGLRPYPWMRRLVMSSAEVRELVAQESKATGRDTEELRQEIESTLDRIAARLSWPMMRLARVLMNMLWTRIYSGVDIPDEDLERIREAVREGSAVLVPCHRSHLDYMLISSVLFEHDIAVPHVVAGDNLAFWPLGPILRRCGGIFIKRRFRDDRVFPVVFERYFRQLVRDGVMTEFFIEGGRSRTGKLLPPKLGILGMVLGAWDAMREGQEISLLPVAISYEQVAESKAFAKELAGKQKKTEDPLQLAKASRTFFERYGRVYLRVGEPVKVSEVMAPIGGSWSAADRATRREVLQRTGERLMHRISQSMVLLPTGLVALALLCEPKRGIRLSVLAARSRRLDALLRRRGAPAAASLGFGNWALQEALQRFERERWIKRLPDETDDLILQIVSEHRVAIAYAKNALVSYLAPVSLVAAAVGATRDPESPEVEELVQLQAWLLRYEATLDPDRTIAELVADALEELVRYGALAREQGRLVVASPALLRELAEVMADQLESLTLVLRASQQLGKRDLDPKELPRHIREVGQGLLAVDELRRPECLALTNLQNGVRAFMEDGVLELKSGGAGLQFNAAGLELYLEALRRLTP